MREMGDDRECWSALHHQWVMCCMITSTRATCGACYILSESRLGDSCSVCFRVKSTGRISGLAVVWLVSFSPFVLSLRDLRLQPSPQQRSVHRTTADNGPTATPRSVCCCPASAGGPINPSHYSHQPLSSSFPRTQSAQNGDRHAFPFTPPPEQPDPTPVRHKRKRAATTTPTTSAAARKSHPTPKLRRVVLYLLLPPRSFHYLLVVPLLPVRSTTASECCVRSGCTARSMC